MKAAEFDYERPASLADAVAILAAKGADAKIIAGGQTLVPLMAMRLARPALLVDINRIAELQGISREGAFVAIRACTRQADALAHASVRADAPLLAKALAFVGHGQTRNRGTVGGSLANADPAAEIGLAALALDAEVEARSAKGTRTIALREFFKGAMETAIHPEECLVAVRFPVWPGRVGAGFHEVSVRASDFAFLAVAAQVELDAGGQCRRAALSIGGAAMMPRRIGAAEARLAGTRLEASDIAQAAGLAAAALDGADDAHGSARYRRRVAMVLAERALAEARDEALSR
ncbi:MAG TPA: xanthine dehydrogenase family protein subunit M [Stellaceae bacterium]|nr:xanthine dehydrogenase family protein subunit M [Stellaceae bacterium]